MKKKRVGIVGIFVNDTEKFKQINNILNEYSHLIKGRLGLPFKEHDLRVISLVFEGDTDELGSFTGKIGQFQGIEVKTLLSKEVKYD